MPYLLRPVDGAYRVIDKITGKTVAAYASHDKAVAHIRKLMKDEKRGKAHPWFTTPS